MGAQNFIKTQIKIIGMLFCLVLFAVGCGASFPGRELPRVTYEQIAPHDPKPTISYEANFVELGEIELGEMRYREFPKPPSGLLMLEEEIGKVFNKSQMFSEINTDARTGQYHITLFLHRKAPAGFASESLGSFYTSCLWAYTLFIFPYYEKSEYFLTAEVKKGAISRKVNFYKNGDQVLKQYEYRDHMKTWAQFPFLLILSATHHHDKVERKVIDNMLLNFLNDLGKDKIL